MWRKRGKDLEREIESHLELETEERQAAGRSRSDAARAAHLAFGSVAQAMEDTREVWGALWFARTVQDLHYALRLMRRTPIVTMLAILSLGLGIGATSAIYSAFDALLLRALPVSAPAQLIDFGIVLNRSQSQPFTRWNYDDYVNLRDGLSGVSDVVAIGESDRSHVQLGNAASDPRPVHVALVSGNYFSLFGVGASAGRLLTVADDRVPGGHPVAVISDAYRRRHFAATADVIGWPLKLNETTYDIIGVTTSSFKGDWIGHPTDVWIPIAMQSQVMIERPGLLTKRGATWIRIVARMQPGASITAIEAAANSALGADSPPAGSMSSVDQQRVAEQRVIVRSEARGHSDERAQLGAPMTIVVAIAGLVLLIACANVANLQLARATTRATEMAVRSALGASRGRLIRQAFAESALLAISAGAAGFGMAVIGIRILERLVESGATELVLNLHADWHVFLVTSASTLGTALVFGMVLARAAWIKSLSPVLWERSVDHAGTSDGFGLTKVLVTVQVALSMILLIGAGLFVRTLRNLETRPLGLDRNHVLLVEAAPLQEGVVGSGIADLMSRLPDELASRPGVRSAAASTFAPLGREGSGSRCAVLGYSYRADEDYFVRTNPVTPRYFETMGMTLIAGRDFDIRDTAASERVAVVNETMARYYWRTSNAVGRRFGLGHDTGNEIEVVGVVKDANLEGLRDAPERTVFLPYRQAAAQLRSLTLEVKADGPEGALRTDIRSRLRDVVPSLPLVSLHSVDENMAQMLWTERLMASFSALFGALALLLTCLGLYGVMSYVTARRTNEIGIRMALGASVGQTMRLVLAESLWQVGVGLLLGLPSALMLTRATSSLLFGVTATDAVTIAEAIGALVVVAAAASSLPAYRATRVNTMTALRGE